MTKSRTVSAAVGLKGFFRTKQGYVVNEYSVELSNVRCTAEGEDHAGLKQNNDVVVMPNH